ncbi:MAG: hypothetical protein O2890_03650 [Cyanobacteria bacterium]|nr:hypothetical protein [Cyanobacteriota bacterium]MDA0865507.1 hypothetical protein [Cyanobacteriota bacterium]
MPHPNAYTQQYSFYYDQPEAMSRRAVLSQQPQLPHPRVSAPQQRWSKTGPKGASPMAHRPYPQKRAGHALPKKTRRRRPQFLWAGGGMVAFAALVVTPQFASPEVGATTVCQQRVETQSVLSRDELSELLAIPEQSSREAVEAVIAEPFCVLNQTEIRAGISAERVAYPLAFDPQTWLIVLYEEGEYAGYDFSFTRE